MDLPKIRYFLQTQQTFRRGIHNRENDQKYLKCILEVFWRCSGVFEVRQSATQGLHGDNRRTGVKMDSIEDTILTATPLVQCEMREPVLSSKSHPDPTKPLISEWKATLHSGQSNMCAAYLLHITVSWKIETSNAKQKASLLSAVWCSINRWRKGS